jgi:hypothetical protein
MSSSAGPSTNSSFPLPSHSKQFLMELTDYSLTSLIRQCRSSNPAKRPKMMIVVMQLQQMLVRHVVSGLGNRVGTDIARKMICSGTPPSSSSTTSGLTSSFSEPSSSDLALQRDPMSAPLSTYLPKKKKATLSPPVEQHRERLREEQYLPYQGVSRSVPTTSRDPDYSRSMPALVPATSYSAYPPSTSLPSDPSRLSSSLPTSSNFPIHDMHYGAPHVPQVVFQPPTPLPRDGSSGYMRPPSESEAWKGAIGTWETQSGIYQRRRTSNAGLIVPAHYGGRLDDSWNGPSRGMMGMYNTKTL